MPHRQVHLFQLQVEGTWTSQWIMMKRQSTSSLRDSVSNTERKLPSTEPLFCALTASGKAHLNAAVEAGAVCSKTKGDKQQKFAEFLEGERCLFVFVALERWEGNGAMKPFALSTNWLPDKPINGALSRWRRSSQPCRR